MRVNVKCFSSLADSDNCSYEQSRTVDFSADSPRVADLAEQVRVSRDDIALVFLNGRRAGLGDRLADGDRVAFVPSVGGM